MVSLGVYESILLSIAEHWHEDYRSRLIIRLRCFIRNGNILNDRKKIFFPSTHEAPVDHIDVNKTRDGLPHHFAK
ncbi:hypothetical protein ACN47E_005270 [Coniothyrium glycines]